MKVRKIGFWRDFIKYRVFLTLMLPALLIVIFNNYIPMFGVIVAFKNYNYIGGILHSPWSGWENFKYLVQTDEAWLATRNTLTYNSLFIVINTATAVTVAIALNEIRNRKLAKFFQSAMLFPYFLSFVAISYLAYALLGENGFINTGILKMFGVDAISWYSNPFYWKFILPMTNLWKNIGYIVVVYLASITSIDGEYYESAVIDGASKWKQIRFITIPLMRPVIITMVLLQVSRIFNADFGLFYQLPLNTGTLHNSTEVIDTFVFRNFLVSGNVGMSAAAGLYQAVVGFVVILITNSVVRKVNKEEALF
ncbi:sugar ABC transporter permease [Paenibacillus pectinilyticus]|uniref:Sugar ABC transporter permease n=2 Tax=Paenibacillus pectinilyticus TaxID=512399 RepID=A0A1C1A5E0_9BACL|nr:sugar ABC transporter permease [Paenibacillus pectinilyticus]